MQPTPHYLMQEAQQAYQQAREAMEAAHGRFLRTLGTDENVTEARLVFDEAEQAMMSARRRYWMAVADYRSSL